MSFNAVLLIGFVLVSLSNLGLWIAVVRLLQRPPQITVVVNGGQSGQVLLSREAYIRDDGAIPFWGDGTTIIPPIEELKEHRGKKVYIQVVEAMPQG